ncbi:hypothetical protein [Aquitalea aquatica]|nr:hypothetical protein [Aquitalea magnusonii]
MHFSSSISGFAMPAVARGKAAFLSISLRWPTGMLPEPGCGVVA